MKNYHYIFGNKNQNHYPWKKIPLIKVQFQLLVLFPFTFVNVNFKTGIYFSS